MTAPDIVCVEWTEPVDVMFVHREARWHPGWLQTGLVVYIIEQGAEPLYVGVAPNVGVRIREHIRAKTEIGAALRTAKRGEVVLTVRWTEAAYAGGRNQLEQQVIFALLPRFNRINPTWRNSPLLSLVPALPDREAA